MIIVVDPGQFSLTIGIVYLVGAAFVGDPSPTS